MAAVGTAQARHRRRYPFEPERLRRERAFAAAGAPRAADIDVASGWHCVPAECGDGEKQRAGECDQQRLNRRARAAPPSRAGRGLRLVAASSPPWLRRATLTRKIHDRQRQWPLPSRRPFGPPQDEAELLQYYKDFLTLRSRRPSTRRPHPEETAKPSSRRKRPAAQDEGRRLEGGGDRSLMATPGLNRFG